MIKPKVKHILILILLILSLIFNIVLIYIIYTYASADKCYVGDEADKMLNVILNNTSNFNNNGEYAFVWRAVPNTNGLAVRSSVVAVTKDRKLYGVYGYQPWYYKSSEKEQPELEAYYCVEKVLNKKEFTQLYEAVKNACNEYENENVAEVLNKYSSTWTSEYKVLFDNKAHEYEIAMLKENSDYNNSYPKDKNSKSLELPELSKLTFQYILDTY